MNKNTAIILIHGFGGGVHEIEPLAAHLESLGYEVKKTELAGHSGDRKAMGGATHRDWIRSAEDDYLQLSGRFDNIVLVGFSTGGLIAANLAAKYPVAAIITISTPIYVWNLGRIAGNIIDDARRGSAESLKWYIHSASSFPLSSLFYFKILQYRSRRLFSLLTCPLYALQGYDDDTVHHRSADYIYRHAASQIKQIDYFDRSGHVMLNGPSAGEAIRKISSFIASL